MKMNRREFLKRSLEGLYIVSSIPLISSCSKNPVKSEPVNSNSIIKDNIEYYIQTDKSVYKLGEKVEMLYRVTNVGKEPSGFSFKSSQWYDFNVKKLDEEIWKWSYDKAFLGILTNFLLNPGEYKEFIENWNMVDNNGKQVKPGNYNVTGVLGSFYPRYEKRDAPPSVAINIKLK